MEWTKISIQTTTAGAEIVSGLLMAHGISGMEIIDPGDFAEFFTQRPGEWDYADEALLDIADDGTVQVVFYVSADGNGMDMLAQVRTGLNDMISYHSHDELGPLSLTVEEANDKTGSTNGSNISNPYLLAVSPLYPAGKTTPHPPTCRAYPCVLIRAQPLAQGSTPPHACA